ncbi:lytic murein transglycosylase [Patescibacteria group bacterium]|nr:lytic murein transglycosylase [Patescibacteria group bacterium]
MKRNKLLKTIHYTLFTIVFISVLFLPNFVFGEEDLTEICQEIINKGQQNLSKENYQALLKECQAFYEEEIAEIQGDLSKTGAEKKTLENKIYTLNKRIKNLNYQIYQSNLIIKDLGIQVEDTGASIEKTSLKIGDSKEKLANILRTIYEEDQKPIIEILLSEDELSDFFDNLVALELLNSKGKELLQNIKTLKINLEEQKISLDEEKEDLEHMVEIQTLQSKESAETKEEQEYYLKITDAQYQKQLQERQEVEAKAAEIRARIFELIGIPKAPTFGEAYELAKEVEKITGVRPAFLLAVLTQESNIGKNVGQCYLKDTKTGAGETIKTGRTLSRVMKPTRDVNPFLIITKELGRDPFNTPVSCPMSYGWGGAMGPAQFIPSTWMLYRDRLKAIAGKPGDPWNIKDAFLAAALYLADCGAAKQTYDGEFNAALSYFAGPGWYKSRYKTIYKRDYGYPVMAITKAYESDIAKIK